MASIKKIRVAEQDYDIAATSIEPVSEIPLVYGGAASGGSVSINSKGNVSVESLLKHVNIEAAKGIQMKPTTNIIIDTGRRLEASGGNECEIQVVYDDYDSKATSGPDGYDERWGYLKVKARAIDLRCNDHGGVALQPCGKDSNGFENKIKFESSRTNEIGADTATYTSVGGDGMEFGTFNNLHTSLYTGDYRFKGDAKVYGVTRGAVTEVETGKKDYPTQADDFKDIIDETTPSATWNEIIGLVKRVAELEAKVAALENNGETA